jgi:hypothetical protein
MDPVRKFFSRDNTVTDVSEAISNGMDPVKEFE